MKKLSYLFISFILLLNLGACAGYKPIFSSANLEFKIVDYLITGNKQIGNQFYSKLYNLFQSSQNNSEVKNIFVQINVTERKNVTAKDSAGKTLAYKIDLSVSITVRDFMTGNQILKENFSSSSSYKVQDQYSETLKLEKKSLENLINKTSQDLLIKLSENIYSK